MKTYAREIVCQPAPGIVPNDLLSAALSAVDAVTIVCWGSAVKVSGTVVSVKVRFYGLNPNEAAETTRRAVQDLRVLCAAEPEVTR